MARKEGQRQAVAALCAVMTWSLFATPAAALQRPVHAGLHRHLQLRDHFPTKLSRMSFEVTAYPAAFFEASHAVWHLESENETLAKSIASHNARRHAQRGCAADSALERQRGGRSRCTNAERGTASCGDDCGLLILR
ncbi:hypothetical protein T484DRAFT_1740985 [Baffinella frigidus]|nr:hypothetical protein T484DRAFT_1740985 [Cryptophyta sp. CCMP2293]